MLELCLNFHVMKFNDLFYNILKTMFLAKKKVTSTLHTKVFSIQESHYDLRVFGKFNVQKAVKGNKQRHVSVAEVYL